jgi:hypothetical protein
MEGGREGGGGEFERSIKREEKGIVRREREESNRHNIGEYHRLSSSKYVPHLI